MAQNNLRDIHTNTDTAAEGLRDTHTHTHTHTHTPAENLYPRKSKYY